MEERGFGQIADVLVFSVLVSTAITLLAASSPIDPRIESARYASSFARSVLLSLQHSTADQSGGFEYSLGAFGFELDLPLVGRSVRRDLRHKTLAQLLAEDAILNISFEVGGTDIELSRPNQAMESGLRSFLKSTLDRVVGGRFGYRLRVSTEPIDLGFARVHFEDEIEDLSRARNQLCSETVMLPSPASREEIARLIERLFGLELPLDLEIDLVVEVTLELWSI